MTKEKVIELYQKYQEADYRYHQYVDQFITEIYNGEVINEPIRERRPDDDKVIENLDMEADKARLAYEDAFKKWDVSL
jgi:hypothetical protein